MLASGTGHPSPVDGIPPIDGAELGSRNADIEIVQQQQAKLLLVLQGDFASGTEPGLRDQSDPPNSYAQVNTGIVVEHWRNGAQQMISLGEDQWNGLQIVIVSTMAKREKCK